VYKGLCASFIILMSLPGNAVLADAGKTLVISNGATKPPMHTKDFTGFIDIILGTALKRIGYQLDTRALPNERSLINADRGIIDGESNRIAGLDEVYPNLIRVPEKIMDWEFVAFATQDIDMANGWESLTPHLTCFITGWKIFEFNVPRETVVTKIKHPEQLFILLDKNRVDIALYELWQGLGLIQKFNYKGIRALSPPLAKKEMFTYLNKKHVNLVPKLAQSLKELKADGTYERIYTRILAPLKNR